MKTKTVLHMNLAKKEIVSVYAVLIPVDLMLFARESITDPSVNAPLALLVTLEWNANDVSRPTLSCDIHNFEHTLRTTS